MKQARPALATVATWAVSSVIFWAWVWLSTPWGVGGAAICGAISGLLYVVVRKVRPSLLPCILVAALGFITLPACSPSRSLIGSMPQVSTHMPDSPDTVATGRSAIDEARADMGAWVRRGTTWIATVMVLVAAGIFVLAATGIVPTLSARGAFYALLAALGTMLARTVLLAYGMLAAHIAAWVGIASLILLTAALVWPIAVTRFRAKVYAQGRALTAESIKTETPQLQREAVALLAVADDRIGKARKGMLEQLDKLTDRHRPAAAIVAEARSAL